MTDFKKIFESIKIPTEEEMIESASHWWELHKEINFNDWNDTLLKHSFPLYIIKIPKDLFSQTIELLDGHTEETFNKVVKEYELLLGDKVSNSFFAKLITRSPKDFLYDENNFGKPLPLTSVYEMLHAFTSSMRTFDDMCLLRYLDVPQLVIRPYINFHPQDEYRVFINQKKIVGISQYYYSETFPLLSDPKIAILDESTIRKFVNEIVIPNFKIDNYIADIVIGTDGRETVILEANPWGISDPCLFVDYQSFDDSFRYNKAEK